MTVPDLKDIPRQVGFEAGLAGRIDDDDFTCTDGRKPNFPLSTSGWHPGFHSRQPAHFLWAWIRMLTIPSRYL